MVRQMTEKPGIFLAFCVAGLLIPGCLSFTPQSMSQSTPLADEAVPSGKLPTLQESRPGVIFLIALEDARRSGTSIGCGVSLVPVEAQTGSNRESLEYLLEQHSNEYGQSGLYNALSRSDLHVIRFTNSGTGLEVDLEGELVQGGVCDIPRIRSQLESTIRQSSDPRPSVTIRVNGILLDELLSLK